MIELFFVAFTTIPIYRSAGMPYYGGIKEEVIQYKTADKACRAYARMEQEDRTIWRIIVSADFPSGLLVSKPVQLVCHKY